MFATFSDSLAHKWLKFRQKGLVSLVDVAKRTATYSHSSCFSAWRQDWKHVQPVSCACALRSCHVFPALGSPWWPFLEIQLSKTHGPWEAPCTVVNLQTTWTNCIQTIKWNMRAITLFILLHLRLISFDQQSVGPVSRGAGNRLTFADICSRRQTKPAVL